jgi:signal transduction histidine kinase
LRTVTDRPSWAPARGRTGAGRWRLRHWPLRTKLLAVLVVPLLLAGVLGTARVVASAQDAADLDALVGRVVAGQRVADLVDALQDERVAATAFVAAGRTGDRAGLAERMRRVDAAATLVTAAAPDAFGPAVADVEAAARVRLGDLAALRRAVTGTAFPAERVEAAYTSVVAVLLALERGVLSSSQPSLLRPAADAVLVAEEKEQVQRQHAVLSAVLLSGAATTAQRDALRDTEAGLTATSAQLDATALTATRDRLATTVAGADVDDRERVAQGALVALAAGTPVPAAAPEWDAAAGRTAALVRQVESASLQDLAASGADLAATARAAALRDGVVVAVLVALAMLLLALVARSLLVPLRALRASAFDIARRTLPARITQMTVLGGREPSLDVEPVGVHTHEEIGEVARAFDAIHASAVRLAAEQAMLRQRVNDVFVTLSRRSQTLVRRQLELVERLERTAWQPDQLDELHRLDHLANRLRRHNENLLVLAGEPSDDAFVEGAAPVADVLAAAVAEIELRRQVVVGGSPDVAVAGPAVADLVHLLAELLDNATIFSPPDATVSLGARTAADGGLAVEILDGGVGMADGELATINAQLADPPLVDLTVSRRMGLFVVGSLARRHGVGVALRAVPTGAGVLATVTLPQALLRVPDAAVAAGAGRSGLANGTPVP